LGVYDLIAAAEWRELTSRSSALEQTERTHDRSTQASQSYANANKQGRLCQTASGEAFYGRSHKIGSSTDIPSGRPHLPFSRNFQQLRRH
jgi:hypothetical protein